MSLPDLSVSAGRVLLVDDEPALIRSYSCALRKLGYHVTSARDGRQAVEEIEKQAPFDAVVSDLSMPSMGGLDFLRELRTRELDVPVVVLTGYPGLESALVAMEQGAFRYLTKPIGPEAFLDVVARAVQWRRLSLAAKDAQGALCPDWAELYERFSTALQGAWVAMQPVVSWNAKTIFAFEARVRTDNPRLRQPAEIFEAGERLGRTAELGRTIRRRVAATLRDGTVPSAVFVHIHPAELQDAELFDPIGILSPFASRIFLQITDRLGLERVPDLRDRVARLRLLGYRIAIDDLGSGYASLSSVAEIEPDLIKADMSLVRGIDASSVKQKLYRTLITLGRNLDVTIVAEGVETVAERDCLVALGGDLMQGFLFAAPGRGAPTPAFGEPGPSPGS